MIRNKNARRLMRTANKKRLIALAERAGCLRRGQDTTAVDQALRRLPTSHIIVTRAGDGSLPYRRDWLQMRARKATRA
jgi:hypothetical protein